MSGAGGERDWRVVWGRSCARPVDSPALGTQAAGALLDPGGSMYSFRQFFPDCFDPLPEILPRLAPSAFPPPDRSLIDSQPPGQGRAREAAEFPERLKPLGEGLWHGHRSIAKEADDPRHQPEGRLSVSEFPVPNRLRADSELFGHLPLMQSCFQPVLQ